MPYGSSPVGLMPLLMPGFAPPQQGFGLSQYDGLEDDIRADAGVARQPAMDDGEDSGFIPEQPVFQPRFQPKQRRFDMSQYDGLEEQIRLDAQQPRPPRTGSLYLKPGETQPFANFADDNMDLVKQSQQLLREYDTDNPGKSWGRYYADRSVPGFSTGKQLGSVAFAKLAVDKLDTMPLTQDDATLLARYLNDQEDDEKRQNEKGFVGGLKRAGNIAAEIPAFAGELLATGGLGTGARKAAQKYVVKAIGQKFAARMAARGVGIAASTAVRTNLMPARVAKTAIERKMQHPEESWVEAMAHSEFQNLVEVFTENVGGKIINRYVLKPISGVAAQLAKKSGVYDGLRIALIKEWLAKHQSKSLQDAFAKVGKAGGWDGLLGEVGEERMNEIILGTAGALGATGKEYEDFGATGNLASGEFGKAYDQLWPELVAFAAPGAGAKLLDAGANYFGLGKSKQERIDEFLAKPDSETLYRKAVAAGMPRIPSPLEVTSENMVNHAKAYQAASQVQPDAAPEESESDGTDAEPADLESQLLRFAEMAIPSRKLLESPDVVQYLVDGMPQFERVRGIEDEGERLAEALRLLKPSNNRRKAQAWLRRDLTRLGVADFSNTGEGVIDDGQGQEETAEGVLDTSGDPTAGADDGSAPASERDETGADAKLRDQFRDYTDRQLELAEANFKDSEDERSQVVLGMIRAQQKANQEKKTSSSTTSGKSPDAAASPATASADSTGSSTPVETAPEPVVKPGSIRVEPAATAPADQAPAAVDYEKNFDRQQELLKLLPKNIGKAKQEGKLTDDQKAVLVELDGLEKEFPNTDPKWQEIFNRKRVEYDQKQADRAVETRKETEAKLAERGFADGDVVTIPPTSLGGMLGAPARTGKIKIGKNGTAYVASGGEQLDVFGNPWKLVRHGDEKKQGAPGESADAPKKQGSPSEKSVEQQKPPFDWASAKTGDILPDGRNLVIRGVRKKADAKEIAARSGGEVMIDGPGTWAVAAPDVWSGSKPEQGEPPVAESPKPEDEKPEPDEMDSLLDAAMDEVLGPAAEEAPKSKKDGSPPKASGESGGAVAADKPKKQGSPKEKPLAGAIQALSDAEESARAAKEAAFKAFRDKAAKKGFGINAALDPELAVEAVKLMSTLVRFGTVKFAKMVTESVSFIGEASTRSLAPYLERGWEKLRSRPGFENLDDAQTVESVLGPEQKATVDDDGRNDAGGSPSDKGVAGGVGEPGGTLAPASGGVSEDGATEVVSGSADEAVSDKPDQAARGAAGPDGVGVVGDGAKSVSGDEPGVSGAGVDSAGGASVGGVQGTVADTGVVAGNSRNLRIGKDDVIAPKGDVTKIRSNLAALRLVKQLTAEGRQATPDEQRVLMQYVGWGGLKNVFDRFRGAAYVKKPGFSWEKTSLYKPPGKNVYLTEEQYRTRIDAWEKQWGEPYKELKELLTNEEWESAAASIANAHYTSRDVVSAVWDAAKRLGLSGGTILEPSAGVGNFLGLMPDGLAQNGHLIAVELDQMTGKILEQLYPDAKVFVKGFEAVPVPPNSVDLAITNVPFAKEGPSEAKECYGREMNLHNYFIARMLDALKPGGVAAVITTHYTMDANAQDRVLLASKADLIGAIRLPNDAFKANANTEVTTDILFFRKPDGIPFQGEAWANVVQVAEQTVSAATPKSPNAVSTKPITANEYFLSHPEMVLGTHSLDGEMYAGDKTEYTVQPIKGADLVTQLRDAVARLPENVSVVQDNSPPSLVWANDNAAGVEGQLQVVGGKLLEFRDGKLQSPQWATDHATLKADGTPRKATPATLKKRLAEHDAQAKAYVSLRDVMTRHLATMQDKAQTEADFQKSLKGLNAAYDAFRKGYGPVNSSDNAWLMGDPGFFGVAGLENEVEGVKSGGVLGKNFAKADIFTSRILPVIEPPHHANSVEDAVKMSLTWHGRLSLPWMAELLGQSESQLSQSLMDSGAVFLDPATGLLEPSDTYLSGNVRDKLKIAEQAVRDGDGSMAKNVSALKAVQPAPVAIANIGATLGATWIEAPIVERFLRGTVGAPVAVRYDEKTDTWRAMQRGESERRVQDDWGTQDYSVAQLAEKVLNLRDVTVYRMVDSGELNKNGSVKMVRVVDPTASAFAEAKAMKMRQAFERWAKSDPTATDELETAFNEKKNFYVKPKWNGEHMTFPGMAPAWEKRMRPYQRNTVWRMIRERRGMLAHGVGAGKAQPLDAKLLTPTGWKLMGEIQKGDFVIGANGQPTEVMGVFPQGEKEIFRVTFNDGSSTECCDEHLWLTQTYYERNKSNGNKKWECGKAKVRSLSEIRCSLKSSHLGAKNHSIPIVAPVHFNKQEVPLDPYLLGALLGDGGMTQSSIYFTTADADMVSNVQSSLPQGCELRKSSSDEYGYYVSGRGCRGPNRTHPVRCGLDVCGLSGKRSEGKFIPTVYLINDVATRVAMLQGLMDTDGWVQRHSLYFSTSSPRLAEDVTSLVQSLGGTVRRTKKQPHFTHKGIRKAGLPAHVLCLSLPSHIVPFRLPRKLATFIPKTKYVPIRYIVEVESVGIKHAQCIRVAAEDHLYVTDDYIVTHNTLEMIAAAMEMKRLGIVHKSLLVVQNSTLGQFAATFQKVYPSAKVLVARPEDLNEKNRRKFMSRIMTGNWDAVVMAQSTFSAKLPNDPAREEALVQGLVSDLLAVLAEYEAQEGRGSPAVKAVQAQINALKARLQKIRDRLAAHQDSDLYFEQMGIDALFLDESHCYKKPPFVTKIDNKIKGLSRQVSGRSLSALTKIRFIQDHSNGKNVFTATGTPITNTLGEAWHQMSLVAPDVLREFGVETFDRFVTLFASVEMSQEQNAVGRWAMVRRLGKFKNGFQFGQFLSSGFDILIGDELHKLIGEASGHGLPKLKDGKPLLHLVEKSASFDRFHQFLVQVYDAYQKLDGKDKRLYSWIPVQVYGAARAAALDIRLVDPTAEDDPGSKVNATVDGVYQGWLDGRDKSTTQLVFCDTMNQMNLDKLRSFAAGRGVELEIEADDATSDEDDGDGDSESTKKGKKEETKAERFLYDDIRTKLIAKGIPADQVVIINDFKTDAAKKALFDKVNAGTVRIVLGHSETLGTGVNVQEKLEQIWELDTPFYPALTQQRVGRMVRSGNTNETVTHNVMGMKGSLDQVLLDLNLRKLKFIEQALSGKLGHEFDDPAGETVMSMADMMAALMDDPLFFEQRDLEYKVRLLSLEKEGFLNQQASSRREALEREKDVRGWNEKAKSLASRLEKFQKKNQGDVTVTVGGRDVTGKAEISKAIDEVVEKRVADIAAKTQAEKMLPWRSVQRDGNDPQNLALDIKIGSVDVKLYYGQHLQVKLDDLGNRSESWVGEYDPQLTFDGESIYSGAAHTGKGLQEAIADYPANTARWIQNYEKDIERSEKTVKSLREILDQEFDKEAELRNNTDRLDQVKSLLVQRDSGKPSVRPPSAKPNLPEAVASGFVLRPGESPRPRKSGRPVAEVEDDDLGPGVTAANQGKQFVEDYDQSDVLPKPLSAIRRLPTPELVELATELMGAPPRLSGRLRSSLGLFRGVGRMMEILLKPSLAKNPKELAAVLAHEIGHLIDYYPDHDLKRGNLLGRLLSMHKFLKNSFGDEGVTNKELRKELIALSEWWSPYDKGKTTPRYIKYRQSAAELYADALSVLLNAPAEVAKRAPKFFEKWQEHLDKKPEVGLELVDLWDALSPDKDITERRRARLQKGFAAGNVAAEQGQAARDKSRDIPFSGLFRTLQQLVLDRYAPLKRRARKQGMDEEVRLLSDLFSSDNESYLILDRTNRLIHQPLEDAGVTDDDIGEYLVANRIVSEVRQDQKDEEGNVLPRGQARWEIANPLGLDKETSQQQLDGLKKKIGDERYKLLEDKMREWHRDILWPLVAEAEKVGVYSRETVREVLEPNADNYATFAVVRHIDGTVSPGIAKQIGTFEDIGNPFHFTLLKALSLSRLNQFNKAKGMVIHDLLPKTGEVTSVEVPHGAREPVRPLSPGLSHMGHMEDGKLKWYSVPKEVAASFDGLNLGAITDIVSKLQEWKYRFFHPLYVTFAPGFLAANPFRDLQRTWHNLGALHGTTARQVIKAWIASIPAAKKAAAGEYVQQLEKMIEDKAYSVSFVDLASQKEDLVPFLPGAKKSRFESWVNDSTFIVPKLMRSLRYWGQVQEMATKMAGYQLLTEAGVTGSERAEQTRRYVGTPDWKTRGLATGLTDLAQLYSNVKYQANSAALELATSRKTAAGWWWRAMLGAVLPTTLVKASVYGALAFAMGGDWEEWWKMVPKYDRDNNYIIPLPDWMADFLPGGKVRSSGKRRAVYLTIPRDETLNFIARMTGHLIDHGVETGGGQSEQKSAASVRGEAVKDVESLASSGFAPPVEIWLAWQTYLAGDNPEDKFKRRDIVPKRAYSAGGMESHQHMLDWTMDKFGVLGKTSKLLTNAATGFSHDTKKSEGTLSDDERDLAESLFGGLRDATGVGRLLKVSDRGEADSEWNTIERAKTERDQFFMGHTTPTVRRATAELSKLRQTPDEKLSSEDRTKKRVLSLWQERVYEKSMDAMKASSSDSDQPAIDALENSARTVLEAKGIPSEFRGTFVYDATSSLKGVTEDTIKKRQEAKAAVRESGLTVEEQLSALRDHWIAEHQADEDRNAKISGKKPKKVMGLHFTTEAAADAYRARQRAIRKGL